jgi:hypothetical protein
MEWEETFSAAKWLHPNSNSPKDQILMVRSSKCFKYQKYTNLKETQIKLDALDAVTKRRLVSERL